MRKSSKIGLSAQDIDYLEKMVNGYLVGVVYQDKDEYLVYEKPKNINIAKTVLLYHEGYGIDDIASEMKLSKRTIYNYLKTYRLNHNFMKKLVVTNVSELQLYVGEIARDFKSNNIKTYKQAQQRIEELTGIHRGITQIRAFLKNNYFVKNSKRCFYQRSSPVIKIHLKNKYDKIKNQTYLEAHPKEVEDYIYRIASACNYDFEEIIRRLKEKFNLKESDEKIKYWINNNTSLF
mgnify:FL=1